MSDRTVVLELAGEHKLARDLVAGGVFVPGETIPLNEECELVLRDAVDEIRVRAIVVFANGDGVGLQLHNCDADLKQRIASLGADHSPQQRPSLDELVPIGGDEPDGTGDGTTGETTAETTENTGDEPTAETPQQAAARDAEDKKIGSNVHERMRGLPLAQQLKIAHHGELSERVVLERLYSKNVWEALLRNTRLTGPEVARIARMGSLPRPLMEIIVGNGGWLQIPEVRRALLTNPRLGTDQIIRILRMLPKHELKLAAMQTIYPMGVRDQAKKLMKDTAGGG